MNSQIGIVIRNMAENPKIYRRLLDQARKLEQRFGGITSCKVLLERPYHHRYRGNPFHLQVEVQLPEDRLIVSRGPNADGSLVRMDSLIRDTFREMALCLSHSISSGEGCLPWDADEITCGYLDTEPKKDELREPAVH